MTTYILTALSILILGVASVAWAAGAPIPDPTMDPLAFGDLLSQLASEAAWAPLIAAVVVGLVAAVRRWGAAVWPWVATRRGALVLVVLTAAGGSVYVGLQTGQALLAIVVQAVTAALMAVGAHAGGEAAVRGGAASRIGYGEDGVPVEYLKSPELDRAVADGRYPDRKL